MSDLSHAKCLYIDVEQQCWDGPTPPGFTNDIIQIGIVEADLTKLEITRQSSYLVRPKKMQISPFCTELTGITEAMLRAKGGPFGDRFRSMIKQYGPTHKLCLTWGNDEKDIVEACAQGGVESTLNFMNLAWVFRCYYGIKRGVGLENALKMLGMTFEGRPHDAMWDAYNTARVHLALIDRVRKAGAIFKDTFSDSATR